ncbi:MAG: hypothetical protein ACI8YC_001307, partial [Salibacteraceae bacterium]
ANKEYHWTKHEVTKQVFTVSSGGFIHLQNDSVRKQ